MRQPIFIILFLIILGGAGYYWYQNSGTSAPETALPAEQESLTSITPAMLQRLKSLQLDVTLFKDPFFQKLKPLPTDTSSEVLPGRNNPFAPF